MQMITIRFKGEMDNNWSECFEGFTLSYPGSSETILTGLVEDQAAFYGLIGKLRDLGIQIVEVSSVEQADDTKQEVE